MNAASPLALAFCALLTSVAAAGKGPGEGYVCLGKIAPRHAKEIQASNWSVGAETMDRDYTIYANWRRHLGPLGVKKARIQSGWAKTERKKGVYNWAWLDEIIPDMAAQGVEPWVCLCYGNPIYAGGGGTGLGGGLPSSPQALKAWDAFVGAFVERYGKHVREWEVWNEANLRRKSVAEQYADLVVRTAEAIRARQREAKVLAMATPGVGTSFTRSVLELLKQRGKLHLVNEVTYHPYNLNPDASYAAAAGLRKLVASYSKRITIRQGENGAPSKRGSFGALSSYDWTERLQAKWALRRLLGDLGRDIPSSYFAICDMAYRVTPAGRDSDARTARAVTRLKINYKGLLAINNDRTVHHVKEAYRAVQHVTTVFDNTLRRIDKYAWASDPKFRNVAVFAYAKPSGKQVVTVWLSGKPPTKDYPTRRAAFTFARGSFADPVYVDMLSGKVYGIPRAKWSRDGEAHTFKDVPVGDWPVLIADRQALGRLAPAK
jgi:hypothetical protein